MVFSSLSFIYIFLPICLLLYIFAARSIRQKNVVLLIMSLIFYAWGEPKWILLMVISTVVEYVGALLVDKYREEKPTLAKVSLGASVCVALSFLFVFKYFDFFSFNVSNIMHINLPLLGLTLPIGISFYTFQTVTYIVDVYRGRVPVQRNFADLLLYVSMFPQLIAGPIVKYVDVEEQIRFRTFSVRLAADGVLRFLIGLFKKAVLANISGEMATKLLDGDLSTLSFVGAWVGIIAYTLQIYFDFSAYSDMAIGLGKIFGFKYPENFKYPYIADSINDFWKRWHISLTTFFREYLYIPLGGNRRHQVLNLLIVWGFTGLWHGASWNFILWGLYYYVLIVVEKLLAEKFINKLPKAVSHIYTLFFVIIGWALFYFDDMSKLRSFFGVLFGFGANEFISITDGPLIKNHILFFIFAIIACLPVSKWIKAAFSGFGSKNAVNSMVCDVLVWCFAMVLLFINTAAVVGSTYNPFLYFRF